MSYRLVIRPEAEADLREGGSIVFTATRW